MNGWVAKTRGNPHLKGYGDKLTQEFIIWVNIPVQLSRPVGLASGVEDTEQ